MRIHSLQILATGGMACLMAAVLGVSTAHGQDVPPPAPAATPTPEPADSPVNSDTTTTSEGQVVYDGYGAGCPNGYGGGRRGHHNNDDYRRLYMRPEPFSRNDCRDQYIYSQQGYGVPVSVPLAPVVGKQWNYGWGLPSARLTHVPFGWQMYRPAMPPAGSGYQSPPMVYWPTDTMQQGAYYMRTPW